MDGPSSGDCDDGGDGCAEDEEDEGVEGESDRFGDQVGVGALECVEAVGSFDGECGDGDGECEGVEYEDADEEDGQDEAEDVEDGAEDVDDWESERESDEHDDDGEERSDEEWSEGGECDLSDGAE